MPIKYKRSARPASRTRTPKPKKPFWPLFKKREKTVSPAQAISFQPQPGFGNADLFLASQVMPDSEDRLRRWLSPGRLLAALLMIGLCGLGWLLAFGPGQPFLESALLELASRAPALAFTPTLTPSPALTLTETSLPTLTPTSTPTPRPSPTATRPLPSPTLTAEISSTPESACREAASITLAEVGQTLCVQGVVLRLELLTGSTLIVFTNEPGALYWVTYDVPAEMVQTLAPKGRCLQTTGEVKQLAGSPVLIFNYKNLPQPCP